MPTTPTSEEVSTAYLAAKAKALTAAAAATKAAAALSDEARLMRERIDKSKHVSDETSLKLAEMIYSARASAASAWTATADSWNQTADLYDLLSNYVSPTP